MHTLTYFHYQVVADEDKNGIEPWLWQWQILLMAPVIEKTVDDDKSKGLEVGNGGGHSSKYALTFSRAAQLIEPFLYNIALQSLSYFVLQHCFCPET